MKYLGVYYWYVKMARCGCVMHGLEYIFFYVQKYKTRLAACSGPPADLRQATWGARICDIKNNAWVTVNNDIWVTSEAICRWFSRVTKSRVKIIGKSHHEWPKNRHSR